MRTQRNSPIVISKLGIQWVAFLRLNDAWEVLGVSQWLEDLISDSRLNSTFDRDANIVWVKKSYEKGDLTASELSKR